MADTKVQLSSVFSAADDEFKALRGSDLTYEDYDESTPAGYSKGSIVRGADNRYHIAREDIPANPGAFNPALWREASVSAASSSVGVRDALLELDPDERPDFGLFVGVTPNYSLSAAIDYTASQGSVENGEQFTFLQANEFIRAINPFTTFRETNGRVAPTLVKTEFDVGFRAGEATDPTADGAFVEFIIPKQYLNSMNDLYVSTSAASSTGTRQIWFYNGDPLDSGTEITQSLGRNGSDTADVVTSMVNIPDNSDDIHVVISNQIVYEAAVVNRSEELMGEISGEVFSSAVQSIEQANSYLNSEQLTFQDANAILKGLGRSAYWRETDGRVSPNILALSAKKGVTASGSGADETTTAAISEIVIPAWALRRNMIITIAHEPVFAGGSGQYVRVYEGNPTTVTGTKLTPISGNDEENASPNETSWPVSTSSSSPLVPTQDLHICIASQSITSIEVRYEGSSGNIGDLNVIRGGTQPIEHSETTTYNKDDLVFRSQTNRIYIALENSIVGAWNPNLWEEVSLYENARRVHNIANADWVTELRGGARPAEFSETSTYSKGDTVYRESVNRSYIAKIDLTAGAWSEDNWREISTTQLGLDVQENETRVNAIRGGSPYPAYETLTESYSVNDKVFEPTSGLNYRAIEDIPAPANAFDPTKWSELSIESIEQELNNDSIQIRAVRGSSAYPQYRESGDFYSAGDKVFEPTTGLNYEARVSISEPAGSFDASLWRELSVEAISNAASSTNISGNSFQSILGRIATRDGLSDGNTLSQVASNELFSEVIGANATVITSNGRTLPQYRAGTASEPAASVYGGTAVDPDSAGALIEVVIPADTVVDTDLQFTINTSGSGTTRMYVYDGDPIASGTEIEPIYGNYQPSSADRVGVTYDVSESTNDIHIVFGLVNLLDAKAESELTRINRNIESLNVSESTLSLSNDFGYTNGTRYPISIADKIVDGIGKGATFRRTQGRISPQAYIDTNNSGFACETTGQDETTGSAAVAEVVVPSRSLTRDMKLSVEFGQYSGAGSDRDVVVYAGDPNSGGVQLSPVLGTQARAAIGATVWNACEDPNAAGQVTTDLHIVFKHVVVTDLELVHYIELGNDTGLNERIEMRGGTRPTEFSATSNYSKGDLVYRSTENRSYSAKDAITASAWDATEWEEVSISENEARIASALEGQDTIRGEAEPAAFSSSTSYTENDRVIYNGLIYRAIDNVTAGNWSAVDWQEVSLFENEIRTQRVEDNMGALRGNPTRYPDYSPTSPTVYPEGTILHDPTSGYDYRAKQDIPANDGTFDGTNTAKWDQLSVRTNNAPSSVRDRLSELIGNDRLDASAIKGIDTSAKGLLTKLIEVATTEGLSSGDTFSANGANDFISQIGVPATFSTTGSRVLPLYLNLNNQIGFYGGDGSDPANSTNALMELVIPREYFTGSQELRITSFSSSSSGERSIKVYSGDAVSGGVEQPVIRGRTDYEDTSNQTTRFWYIPSGSNDLHIYISRQVILDIALPNKAARWGANLVSANLPSAVTMLVEEADYSHGQRLSIGDATAVITSLGVNAEWRTTNGRVPPLVRYNASSSNIMAGSAGEDETGDTVNLAEIIIPRQSLINSDRILIEHAWTTTSSGEKGVFVYAGDPTSGGVRINPIIGSDETTDASVYRTVWNASSTPDAVGNVPSDIHIVMKANSIRSMSILKEDPTYTTGTDVDEIRGGTKPSTHDATSAYSKYDVVLYNGYSYICKDDIVAKPWDGDDWLAIGNIQTGRQNIDTSDLDAQQDLDLVEIRGGDKPANHNPLVGYSQYDAVTVNNRTLMAIADIPAKAFDANDWHDVSNIETGRHGIQMDATNGRQDSEIVSSRGGNIPSDFSSTNSYSTGDRVYLPSANRMYSATSDNGPGAFDQQDWNEISILENEERIAAEEVESARLNTEITALRGANQYQTFSNSAGYLTGSKVSYLGRNYNALVDITAGAFNPPDWEELSVEENADPESIRDRLQRLTGTDRLDSSAIEYIAAQATVYVSANGNDTNNSGRSINEPVLTLARALVIAGGLGGLVTIECPDSSTFTENFAPVGPVNLFAPNATVNGDITGTALGTVSYVIGAHVGSITVNSGNSIDIRAHSGDITIENLTANGGSVRINDFVGGNFVAGTGIAGDLYVDIERNQSNAVIPTAAGFAAYGRLDDTLIGLSDGGNPANIRDSLQTLTGNNRLDASAIKNIPGASETHRLSVNQTAHGFVALQTASFDGTTWVVGDVASGNTIAKGVISEVFDVDNFTVTFSGVINQATHGLTVGDYYWLGSSGAVSITQPTTGIVQQILFVLDADNILIDIGAAYTY